MIKAWFKLKWYLFTALFHRTGTLELYFYSGNVIKVDGVLDFKYKGGENANITELSVTQSIRAKRKLMVTGIAINAIEGIVWVPPG